MGLDTVELVMRIEEEFNIHFPHYPREMPASLSVVDGLHRFILNELRQRGESPDEHEVFEHLRAIIVRQLGVQPSEVTPEAHIVYDLNAD